MALKNSRHLPLWVFLIALSACAGAGVAPPEEEAATASQIELNAEFRLAAGESVEIPGEDLRVTFVAAVDDSRCPIGVRCVWAGQVSALIQMEQENEPLGELKLTRQPGQSEPSKELAGGYEVLLTGIEPYPEEGKTIQPADYVAHLIVRKEF